MNRRFGLLAMIFTASVAGTVATSAVAAAPPGWIEAGSHPDEYDMGVDKNVVHGGKPSAFLKSKVERTRGFGTLMQMVDADKFRGQRVRLAGHVKSQAVDEWAGLWMRVDGDKNKLLAFDNMQERAIKGSTEWKRYEVVLDVAANAKVLAFGVLLAGKGTVFINGIAIDTVDKSVPTTGTDTGGRDPKNPEPSNLDFEK